MVSNQSCNNAAFAVRQSSREEADRTSPKLRRRTALEFYVGKKGSEVGFQGDWRLEWGVKDDHATN